MSVGVVGVRCGARRCMQPLAAGRCLDGVRGCVAADAAACNPLSGAGNCATSRDGPAPLLDLTTLTSPRLR